MKTNSKQLFRKTIPVVKSDLLINHRLKYTFMGSCFSQNIENKFNFSGLDVITNPFGISFNPISIAHHLGEEKYNMLAINESGKEFSWQCHSSVFNQSVTQLEDLRKIYQNRILECDVVFVTFGSAWVYQLKDSGRVVSNCHKQPNTLFDKTLLNSNQIISSWKKVLDKFPNQKFVFTVSPVRHWKDGVRENNLSKGVLHQAIDALIQNQNCSYYPSYEIVLDELRDYRFYAEDMLHPNQLAIDYIWDHFQNSYFNEVTQRLCSKIEKLRRQLNHRPFDRESEAYLKFQESNAKLLKEINQELGRELRID